MKIAVNKYYIVAGGAIIFLILFSLTKYGNSAPVNPPSDTSFQQNGDNKQEQPSANDETARKIEAFVKDKLTNTPITLATSMDRVETIYIGTFVKKVLVSKANNGGYNVDIDFTNPSKLYGVSQGAMAGIYVSLFKDTSGFDIRRISSSCYVFGEDKYGNKGDQLIATSSLNKEEASKYNWKLEDKELMNLIARNMNYTPLFTY